MRPPPIVAAHRLQSWLLVLALAALTAAALLFWDLSKSLRTVLVGETNRLLLNAVGELVEAAQTAAVRRALETDEPDDLDHKLKAASYEVLRSYPDIEGGYIWGGETIGHSFPSYTEPGSVLHQPPFERELVESALEQARTAGRPALSSGEDGGDLVLVAVSASSPDAPAAWALRRLLHSSTAGEIRKRFGALLSMLVALAAVGIVLRLSFNLQRGFSGLRDGLARLRADPAYRLSDRDRDLKPIVDAVNAMADSRQRLEAELRREDRLRSMGRVVAGVAHEIRNPLNSIRLTVRVLERRFGGAQETRDPIRLILAEVDRLDRLLRDFSAFRTDDSADVRRQAVRPIVEQTIALVAALAFERGVTVQFADGCAGDALVDTDILKQSLMNVLLNAIEACRRGGTVRIALESRPGVVRIVVDDEGPGLSAEQLDHLFEAFYTTKPGGSGLGLAVTRRLLEKMDAAVTGENRPRGARFVVSLRAPLGGPCA